MAKGKYEKKSEPRHKSPPKPKGEPAAREEKTTPEKRRNPILVLLNLVKNLVVWLIALLAVGMMIFTVISVTTLNRSERTIFGYQAFIVLSDSMSATDFDAGDVVLVKAVDPATLQPGDIIAYTSQNPDNFGQTVTHKIRSITTDANGDPAFITYGTTTDIDDQLPVPYSHVLGKHQFTLPKVGIFFQYLRTGPGYMLFIMLPFGILILYQALNTVRLFRKDRKEQMAQLQAERDQLAAEREETRKMLEELKALQNQMQQEK